MDKLVDLITDTIEEHAEGLLGPEETDPDACKQLAEEIVLLIPNNGKMGKYYLEKLESIRALLRTGLAPDTFGYTPCEWADHKINKAAHELTLLIEEELEYPF